MNEPSDWNLFDRLAVGVVLLDADGAELYRTPHVAELLDGTALSDPARTDRRLASLAQTCSASERTEVECFEPLEQGDGVRLSAATAPGGGTVVTVEPLERSTAVEQRMTQFVSQLTHDLRTPLTSILGASDLLLSGRVGEPPEGHKKLLRIVGEGTQRMATLLSELAMKSMEPEGGR